MQINDIVFVLSLIVFLLHDYVSWVFVAGWFGLRKDFCPWLLGICPLLQEYGNISYKVQDSVQEPQDQSMDGDRKTRGGPHSRKTGGLDDFPRTVVPILSIEMPD